MITVRHISTPADLNHAFAIRREVFVEEQNVPSEEEYDEFETISRHFLASYQTPEGTSFPCGTARWRRTGKGIKLERFAVRKDFRGKGVGKALVKAVLDDVFGLQPEPIESIYLHAQVTAMPLYEGFGFKAVGPMFEECNIQHYRMVLPSSAYSHE
ncbi:GNAT family N-acetyltransferase [Rudanella paleaurantiibacter]|uniref:GNAT family N-acetyltransferase n=1 Tax=Rudanella paleaurantiibacter TaxID=2614655 RepID=A0A7J5TY73_9BACT|nr:GNAT family N-acetyltransferase [Rudanella paleaurantiibacter]KAB7730082.1 GNAT family N-acetyltransferase [Rudanella paleaurantiibacter]